MAKTTTKRDRALAKRRQHILEAAVMCILESGYHQTGVREIAKRAGVSLGNLYNHFSGKHEVLAEIAAVERKEMAPILALLHELGIRAEQKSEAARKRLEAAQARRDEQASRLDISRRNREATREGRFFGGQEIEGRLREFEVELRVALAEESRAERALEVALAALAETRVVAPDDGSVYSVFRHVGELIRSNDLVLTLRSSAHYSIVGRLSPEDALRVTPGLQAWVLMPVQGLRLSARVSAIGHQALSTAAQLSEDAETALHEVPIKLVLERAGREIPPGTRVEIRIHTPPAWARGETQVGAPPDAHAS